MNQIDEMDPLAEPTKDQRAGSTIRRRIGADYGGQDRSAVVKLNIPVFGSVTITTTTTTIKRDGK